ncbi:putative methyltransferase type 11 protein [Botrytis cinerea BcDW1]|uniref:Putative methyltransferase type 11 protein n=1 Tax=Botryotinia fuckeliana (strain BcDW1) TaxID=1290391 RepID=M7TL53_BOTF1|nr:putative methyltransferase type 11 protein [Botrytis cinerea BcDW1]
MAKNQEDHWSASAYQNSASFVPKLAGKVLGWLDVQSDDVVLDVGCGDGIIPVQIAHTLSQGSGRIHGIDSSEDMIAAAKKAAIAGGEEISGVCTFQVLDASSPQDLSTLPSQTYTKIFSNAALHWILRPEPIREQFFTEVKRLLKPNGIFVFEMGGMGNVAEMRTALLSVVGRRCQGGLERARQADPWFFPDEVWMRNVLASSSSLSDVDKEGGWSIEKLEREYRATPADKGGIEGWVKLMGKQFFDVLEEGEERREAEKEVCEVLESVCRSPGGGDWIGYVRLRGVVRRV